MPTPFLSCRKQRKRKTTMAKQEPTCIEVRHDQPAGIKEAAMATRARKSKRSLRRKEPCVE